MRKLKVMMRPTRDCNLRCNYCSIGESKKENMDSAIAITAAKKIAEGFPGRLINFTWGGGEPLLAGIDFYQNILDAQDQLGVGVNVENMIQTNGTLINDKWAKFFKKNNFRIGISLDGPKEVNDKNRIFPNGRGTYEAIQKGRQVLKKNDVRHTLLGIVNRKNRSALNESLEYMINQNRPFKLYIATPIGRSETELEDAKSQEDLFQINSKLFEYWMNTGDKFAGLSLKKYLQSVLTGEPRECTYLENCQDHFLGIDHDGSVYPCACFHSDLEEFCYGNILTDSLQEILSHPQRTKLAQRSKVIEEDCSNDCDHFSICYGGCPLKAYLANGDVNSKDYNCTQYQKLFSHIKNSVLDESNIEH
ncbi:MAG: radical SAM protein [archaeon]